MAANFRSWLRGEGIFELWVGHEQPRELEVEVGHRAEGRLHALEDGEVVLDEVPRAPDEVRDVPGERPVQEDDLGLVAGGDGLERDVVLGQVHHRVGEALGLDVDLGPRLGPLPEHGGGVFLGQGDGR